MGNDFESASRFLAYFHTLAFLAPTIAIGVAAWLKDGVLDWDRGAYEPEEETVSGAESGAETEKRAA